MIFTTCTKRKGLKCKSEVPISGETLPQARSSFVGWPEVKHLHLLALSLPKPTALSLAKVKVEIYG